MASSEMNGAYRWIQLFSDVISLYMVGRGHFEACAVSKQLGVREPCMVLRTNRTHGKEKGTFYSASYLQSLWIGVSNSALGSRLDEKRRVRSVKVWVSNLDDCVEAVRFHDFMGDTTN